ncbi:MAG TPA: phosphate ABC transporter substrate-binding protein [Burkholderiales bacterium]
MKALLGDYPVTKLFKQKSGLEFADVKVPNTAFKRVVRDFEFEFAELAIMTYLLAKAHGKPFRLLPAVVTARFQHGTLAYNAARGPLSPGQLAGKKVGMRSYSVTTATWVRGILADDYGVDLSKVHWVTFEDPHVAEFRDPPNATRMPPGKDIAAMLLAGELDAAILAEPPKDGAIRTLIPDPAAAAEAWKKRTGAGLQINHMVVVKDSVSRRKSDELYALLAESRKAAGNPPMNPFGIEANRRNLEAAIDCIHRQGMIPRRYAVEELFE